MPSTDYRPVDVMLDVVRRRAATRQRRNRILAVAAGVVVTAGLVGSAAATQRGEGESGVTATTLPPRPPDTVPAGSELLGRGRDDGGDWTLYTYLRDDRRCFLFQAPTAAGDSCANAPLPLSWSTVSSREGGHAFGTVDPRAATAGVVLDGGRVVEVETFASAPPNSQDGPWAYEFFVAPIPAEPNAQGVVARDAQGAEVARSCDRSDRCHEYASSAAVDLGWGTPVVPSIEGRLPDGRRWSVRSDRVHGLCPTIDLDERPCDDEGPLVPVDTPPSEPRMILTSRQELLAYGFLPEGASRVYWELPNDGEVVDGLALDRASGLYGLPVRAGGGGRIVYLAADGSEVPAG